MNDDDKYQLNQLEQYKLKFLENIKNSAPLVLEAIDKRDKQKTIELLSDFFVGNLDILNNIVVLRKMKGKKFTQEEIDNIRINLFNIMK